VLRPLEAGSHVVVAEIPQLVWPDPSTAARADRRLAGLDAACELPTQTTVALTIELALAVVSYQPSASLLSALDRGGFRQVAAPIFQRFAGRLRLSRIDVYGRPSDALMARLESKAQLLGGAPVVVNAQRGGFVHLGPPAAIASPA
jgi:hypothetical protein